jgi:hypothetical protein
VYKIRTIKSTFFIYILSVSCSISNGQNFSELLPKKGLFISTNKLEWAFGSEVNFYNKQDRSHEYIFSWWEQDLIKDSPNHSKLIIGSTNNSVFGHISSNQNNNLISTSIDINWQKHSDGIYEIKYLKIWWPYFKEAKWFDGIGNEVKNLKSFEGKKLTVKSSFGDFTFVSSHKFKLEFIIRDTIEKDEYNMRDQFLIFKDGSNIISQKEKLKRDFKIVLHKNKKSTTKFLNVRGKLSKNEKVHLIPNHKILPTPKKIKFYDGNILLQTMNHLHLNYAEKLLIEKLKIKYSLEKKAYLQLTTFQDSLLGEEYYQIKSTKNGFNIKHNSIEGLNYAIETLVSSSTLNENGVVFPIFEVEDYPSLEWRGVHMFTGPESLMFHKQMYKNVLFPLKANKIVLQCEQANWLCFPELHNSISVPLEDLKSEFEFLRENNVEPIPLIQSLGHMEWFFKPLSARHLSINPEYPYTLNPFIDDAQRAIKSIWKEAVALLNPSTVHFGLDEIGMIGYNRDEYFQVKIFKKQMSYLKQFAQSENLDFMIWGDMGLAPGDAIDATNGINKDFSDQIRKSIPEGIYITDWHYKPSIDKNNYISSLKLWKENGNLPIASTWFHPENIYGFTHAAIEEGLGTLQTTWADFESSEKNMLKNIEQFGAYILSLDYSWSGKETIPEELKYDPILEWVNRFYSQPIPIDGIDSFEMTKNLNFQDICDENLKSLLTSKIVELDKKTNVDGIQFQGVTNKILPEGSLVAEISFFEEDVEKFTFQIKYGTEIRSLNDLRPLYSSLTKSKKNKLTRLIKQTSIDKLIVKQINPAAGLNINQLSVLINR